LSNPLSPNTALQRTRVRPAGGRSPLSFETLAAMKSIVAIAALMALVATGPITASQEPCGGGSRLAFSLIATERSFHANLRGGLSLYAAKDDGGWELQVFDRADQQHRDNLLYPSSRWHGAFPCQIQPGVGRDTFPDERVVPIRSTVRSLCVRLIGVKVAGVGSKRRYVAGRVEIRADGG